MTDPAILQSALTATTRLLGLTGAELDPASVVQHPDPGLQPGRATLQRSLSELEINPELTCSCWRPSVKPSVFLLEPFGVLGRAENQAEGPTARLVMSSGAKIPPTTRSCL